MGRRDEEKSGEAARRTLEGAWAWGNDGVPKPPPQLALGTRDLERITPEGLPVSCIATAREYAHLATMPDAAIAISPTGRIAEVNPLAEALVGLTREELAGQRISRVLLNVELHDLGGAVRFVPASTGVIMFHRDGRVVPVDVLLCPDTRGAILAVVRPVYANEHASLREDDFAQIVHDLKNPLATIALEAQLLDHSAERLDRVAVKRAVTRITRNLDFVDRLVHDLLDMCAIDSGHFEVYRQPTELRVLLRALVERVVPTRDHDRVRVEADTPVTIEIDELRIERVIANFLQNALKYSPRHAPIVVRLEIDGELARISVLDRGPGLDVSEQNLVFEKYRRATAAAGVEGCGLGLYVSKQIVEAHGGRVGVHSVLGAGSLFFFELPLDGCSRHGA